MRKSTVTVTLALLGPTLLAGCGGNDPDTTNRTGNETSQRGTAGYRSGGGFFGRVFRGIGSTTRGGFGSFGRGFSGGS